MERCQATKRRWKPLGGKQPVWFGKTTSYTIHWKWPSSKNGVVNKETNSQWRRWKISMEWEAGHWSSINVGPSLVCTKPNMFLLLSVQGFALQGFALQGFCSWYLLASIRHPPNRSATKYYYDISTMIPPNTVGMVREFIFSRWR